MENTTKPLSSELTFPTKVLLPLLTYGCVPFAAFYTLSFDPDPKLWGSLLICIATGWLMWKALVPLKRVRMGEAGLYVSNYLKEIIVPFDNIKTVSPASRWDRWQRITVTFHTQTDFGNNVVFLARTRWLAFSNSAQSIAKEIRTAVIHATGKDPEAAA